MNTCSIPNFDFSQSCLLFLGGDRPQKFYSKMNLNSAPFCVCADSGAAHALALGCKPDFLIGDLDSIDSNLLNQPELQNAKIIPYPPEKDYTDGDLALAAAIELAQQNRLSIAVFGSTGDRMDHSLANLLIGQKAANQKIPIVYYYDRSVAYLVSGPNTIQLKCENGRLISILPLSLTAENLCLKGFKYPLDHEQLRSDQARGISNLLEANQGSITLQQGCIYIVQNFD